MATASTAPGPVLAWLLGYGNAKRFTMLSHVWLGVALGLAPIAAGIAIRGGVVLLYREK